MNYQKIHDLIISRATNREKPDCYCERHHVIPKSMGGTDDEDNIVILTAREHFIIHWLLMKIHRNKQMIYAFHAMTKPVGNGRTRYNSHSFKYAREAMGKWTKENMSGKNHPFYGLTGNDHPHYGMKRSKGTRLKMSEKAKKRYEIHPHPNRVKIACVETGEIFQSLSDASKKHPKGNISYALRSGGTAGGLRFSYVNEETGELERRKSTLKGHAAGSRHHLSVKIIDAAGNIFDSAKKAGESVGVTGSAVLISIRQDRTCRGVKFFRGEPDA